MGFLAILPALLGALGPVLQKVIPDEGQRMQAQLDLQRALIDQQSDLTRAMADVMRADATSESPLARNARPITVIWALAMITWVGVVAPMLGLQAEVVRALAGVPDALWSLLTVGIGAYMAARTADKFIESRAAEAKR
ncbi:3TM-type holin [Methylobacterium sp. NFXW15]|uniref:3TM-type holin n=1 Tax=Methylobacterium sp. NFXW15 TaxID=2819512 RepID=UPI003CEA8190